MIADGPRGDVGRADPSGPRRRRASRTPPTRGRARDPLGRDHRRTCRLIVAKLGRAPRADGRRRRPRALVDPLRRRDPRAIARLRGPGDRHLPASSTRSRASPSSPSSSRSRACRSLSAEIGLVSYTLLILSATSWPGLEAVPGGCRRGRRRDGLLRRWRRLWNVELPLALPLIIAGIRIATVTTIGLVMVTALIGLGGVGQVMLRGYNFRNDTLRHRRRRGDRRPGHRGRSRLGWLGRALTPGRAWAGPAAEGWTSGPTVVAWFLDPANWAGANGIPAPAPRARRLLGAAIAAGAIVALPAGLAIGHTGRAERSQSPWRRQLGRAVPSYALLILFVPFFGLGFATPCPALSCSPSRRSSSTPWRASGASTPRPSRPAGAWA